MKISKHRRGFTLFEVIIAMTIAATVLGVLSVTIVEAMNSRHEAARLQVATFLAQQMMNKIKTETDASSDQGEFESFPGYSYEYEIEEVEVDIFSLLAGAMDGGEESDMLNYRRGQANLQESESGFINLKMRKYLVIVHYGNNLQYTLDMFRGTGINLAK